MTEKEGVEGGSRHPLQKVRGGRGWSRPPPYHLDMSDKPVIKACPKVIIWKYEMLCIEQKGFGTAFPKQGGE
jgi:hypothetical protein